MASRTSAQTHPILDISAEWHFSESIQFPQDLRRHLRDNSATKFDKEGREISFCMLLSAGCSHLATLEACSLAKTIQVTVYHLDTNFDLKWKVIYPASDSDYPTPHSRHEYDKAKLHGGITEDGEAVLLIHEPIGGSASAYVVNRRGFTWRKPPSACSTY